MKVYKSKIPFLRLLLFLILGITVRYYVDFSFLDFYTYIFLIIGLLILILAIYNIPIIKYLWIGAFMLLGFVIADQEVKNHDFGPEKAGFHEYVSLVQNIKPSEKGKMLSMDVVGIGMDGDYMATSYHQYAFLLDSVMEVSLGDTMVYSAFQNYLPHDYSAPWEFDFAEYLKTQSTYYSVFIKPADIIAHRKSENFYLYRWLSEQNSYIKTVLKKHLSMRHASVAISIFLGDKSDLEENQITHFREAGLMHIMAVSGLHVGIIYSCILALLMFLVKKVKLEKWSYMIAILVTWLFILICGMPASACRAGLMLTFLVVGKLWFPRTSNINLLAVAAFIQIALEPYVFFTVGFQFSYIAVLGIMFLYQPILSSLSFIPVPSYILKSIAISLAAQLAIGPVSMYYFGFFPTWFWLSSIPAIFLTTVLLWVGVFFIGMSLIDETLTSYFAYILQFLIEGIEKVSQWTTMLPMSGIYYYPTLIQMTGIMLLIMFLVYVQNYGLRSMNKYNLSMMIMPLIIANFSLQYSSDQADIYLIPAKDGMSIFIQKNNKGYVYGNALETAEYTAIESKMHVRIDEAGVGHEFANINIANFNISKLSSGLQSGFIIIDKSYDVELPLYEDVTYILSRFLDKKQIYKWKNKLDEERCNYEDIRYETKLIEL